MAVKPLLIAAAEKIVADDFRVLVRHPKLMPIFRTMWDSNKASATEEPANGKRF